MTGVVETVPIGLCLARAQHGPARAAPLRCATGCPAYPFRCHRSLAEIEGPGLRLVVTNAAVTNEGGETP